MLVDYDFGMDVDIEEGNVVLFVKDYSLPSQSMEPIFVKLATEFDSIYFTMISADEVGDLAEQYNIRSTPTFLFLSSGSALFRIQGAIAEGMLRDKIKHLYQ